MGIDGSRGLGESLRLSIIGLKLKDSGCPHIPSTSTPFFPSFHRTLEVYLLEIMSQVQLVELREKGIVLERVNCYSLPIQELLFCYSFPIPVISIL